MINWEIPRYHGLAMLYFSIMTSFFQLLLITFIILSFGLAVLIPVTFGNPNTWIKNKRFVFLGVSVWFSFVFALGISNSFIS